MPRLLETPQACRGFEMLEKLYIITTCRRMFRKPRMRPPKADKLPMTQTPNATPLLRSTTSKLLQLPQPLRANTKT